MADAVKGVVMNVKEKFIDNTVVPIVTEMMRIFPDGLVISSGLYALLTISFPFSIFFGSMVEATAIFHAIRYSTSYLGIAPMSATGSSVTHICRTGFTKPTTSLLSMSMFGTEELKNPFPSSQIYMLSVASAYLFSTLNTQAKELSALGPSYSARYYISTIFLTVLLFLFVCFRIAYGCESFPVVIMSVPIGIIIGALLVQQNLRLFGAESINLIGIPLLKSRAASGKPIYICPK
jgi:hypothetical protein